MITQISCSVSEITKFVSVLEISSSKMVGLLLGTWGGVRIVFQSSLVSILQCKCFCPWILPHFYLNLQNVMIESIGVYLFVCLSIFLLFIYLPVGLTMQCSEIIFWLCFQELLLRCIWDHMWCWERIPS